MKTTSLGFDKPDTPTNLETVAMTIDEGSTAILMANLTSLYADPVLAVMREYSSNAIDSHIRAGVETPIQVTLPKGNNPFFTVEDYGIGMSKDDIANIYSRYGLSTKNGTNDEIGAFGLGCKSALAITDRFDLVARKDGMETVAYIQKNAKGVGVVHFVSETPTTEPNGVKVTIPVRENLLTRFQNNSNLFDTWKPNSAIIDGKPCLSIQYGDDWIELSPAGEPVAWIAVNKVSEFRTGYTYYGGLVSNAIFVIGGISYSLEKTRFNSDSQLNLEVWRKLSDMLGGNKIVINLPIGSVDLTPSREAIMITDKTLATLNNTVADIAEQVRTSANAYLQTLTPEAGLRFYAANFSLLSDEIDFSAVSYSARGAGQKAQRPEFYGVAYHGEEIPTWVEVDSKDYVELVSREGTALGSPEPVNRVYTINTLNAPQYSSRISAPNNIMVKGMITGDTLAAFRNNLRDYSKSVYGSTNVNAMLTSVKELNKWVGYTYETVTFDDFIATARKYRTMKKSEAQTGSKRSAVAYAMLDLTAGANSMNDHITKITADDIVNEGAGVIYISADIDNISNLSAQWQAVNDALRLGSATSPGQFANTARIVFTGKRIVFLNKGKSSAAFAKKFPQALGYKEAIVQAISSFNSKDATVFAGVASALHRIRDSRIGEYRSTFQTVAEQIGNKGKIATIKDPYVRSVFQALSSENKMTTTALFFAEVRDSQDKVILKIVERAVKERLTEQFSLLNHLDVYYRSVSLADNDIDQIVSMINAC